MRKMLKDKQEAPPEPAAAPEIDPNDLPPDLEEFDIFDVDPPNLSSGSEGEEEEEEEVWNSSSAKAGVEEAPVFSKQPSPPPPEKEEKKTKKNIFKVLDAAKEMGAYTPDVEAWVDDILEEMHGNGGMRVILSPSVVPRPFFSPIGFGIGVFTSTSEVNNLTLPMQVFDPFRMYNGLYGVRVPNNHEHSAFYKKMAASSREEVQDVVNSVRDDANFQLTESFVGVMREMSAQTGWEVLYWIVVRDADTKASERLYEELEKHKGLPFLTQVTKCPVKETFEAAKARRAHLAKMLYSTLVGEDEEIQGEMETETTYHGIHNVKQESAVLVCNGMAPVIQKERHFLLGDIREGIYLLEGENSGSPWSGESVHFCLFPCSTRSDTTTQKPALAGVGRRIAAPEDFCFGAPRDGQWKRVETKYGRAYGMAERVLEPYAIAVSTFTGHNLENSEYNLL